MAAGLRDGFRRQRLTEAFRHLIQMLCAFFAVAGDTRLITYTGGEIPDQNTDQQHHAESHQILRVGDGERAARLHEE